MGKLLIQVVAALTVLFVFLYAVALWGNVINEWVYSSVTGTLA